MVGPISVGNIREMVLRSIHSSRSRRGACGWNENTIRLCQKAKKLQWGLGRHQRHAAGLRPTGVVRTETLGDRLLRGETADISPMTWSMSSHRCPEATAGISLKCGSIVSRGGQRFDQEINQRIGTTQSMPTADAPRATSLAARLSDVTSPGTIHSGVSARHRAHRSNLRARLNEGSQLNAFQLRLVGMRTISTVRFDARPDAAETSSSSE